MITGRRDSAVWCQCLGCGDTLEVTLWLKHLPEGDHAILEPTQDARARDGLLYHRCGGVLRVWSLNRSTVLADSRA